VPSIPVSAPPPTNTVSFIPASAAPPPSNNQSLCGQGSRLFAAKAAAANASAKGKGKEKEKEKEKEIQAKPIHESATMPSSASSRTPAAGLSAVPIILSTEDKAYACVGMTFGASSETAGQFCMRTSGNEPRLVTYVVNVERCLTSLSKLSNERYDALLHLVEDVQNDVQHEVQDSSHLPRTDPTMQNTLQALHSSLADTCRTLNQVVLSLNKITPLTSDIPAVQAELTALAACLLLPDVSPLQLVPGIFQGDQLSPAMVAPHVVPGMSCALEEPTHPPAKQFWGDDTHSEQEPYDVLFGDVALTGDLRDIVKAAM
jgi:hypothetical protein